MWTVVLVFIIQTNCPRGQFFILGKNVTQVFRSDSEESKYSVSRVRPKGLSYINSVGKTITIFLGGFR